MKKTIKRLAGVAAIGALALQAVPALAQQAGTQEVHVYAGALFGDDATDRPISGQTPSSTTTSLSRTALRLQRHGRAGP